MFSWGDAGPGLNWRMDTKRGIPLDPASGGHCLSSVCADPRNTLQEASPQQALKVGNALRAPCKIWPGLGDPGDLSWCSGGCGYSCLGRTPQLGVKAQGMFSYRDFIFSLCAHLKKKKKACMVLMWARLDIMGNDRLKSLNSSVGTAG